MLAGAEYGTVCNSDDKGRIVYLINEHRDLLIGLETFKQLYPIIIIKEYIRFSPGPLVASHTCDLFTIIH